MQQAVGESSRAVRIPTHVLWDMHELKEMRERFARTGRGEPRIVELADALGWSPFFALATAACLPGLVLLAWIMRLELALPQTAEER